MKEDEVGLVPAAGKGLRLNLPYPKELYPIIWDNRYKPVAQFVLDNLRLAGVEHVVVVVNETKHQLMAHFGDGHRFGLQLSYVVQEPLAASNGSSSPGLAHALDSGYHLTKGKTVFFGRPDTIMRPVSVFDTLRRAARPDDDALLALFPTKRCEKFGMVETDADGLVVQVVDKPKATPLTHMWGCIVWRARFTEHLRQCVRTHGIGDFARILNVAIRNGFRVRGVHFDSGSYQDLGTYEEIAEMERKIRQP
jgi:dTDP-glucose pyrophosphorylase